MDRMRLCLSILAGLMLATTGSVLSDPIPVQWDTVATHEIFDGVGEAPLQEVVSLVVSNHGEMGHCGIGGANMDYYVAGLACSDEPIDRVYLRSGSPFLIREHAGTTSITTSIGQLSQDKPYSWKSLGGGSGMTGGIGYGYFDSVYTGRFTDKDSVVVMERTFYAQRLDSRFQGTVFLVTRVYSADGQGHANLTIGDVLDWDIPTEVASVNSGGSTPVDRNYYGSGQDIAFVNGSGGYLCQYDYKYGSQSLLSWHFANGEWYDACCDWNDPSAFSVWVTGKELLGEIDVGGQTLLDANAWVEGITAHPGVSAVVDPGDQIVIATWFRDMTLSSTDTLVYHTILCTDYRGYEQDIANLVWEVREEGGGFAGERPVCPATCCPCKVGDVNGPGNEEPTIGDISAMIDAKFISGTCAGIIACYTQADINQSGGIMPTCDDITISDISILIDYLFIGGPEVVELPVCL